MGKTFFFVQEECPMNGESVEWSLAIRTEDDIQTVQTDELSNLRTIQ